MKDKYSRFLHGKHYVRDSRYSYSKYQGLELLHSWRIQRENVLSKLPPAEAPPIQGSSPQPLDPPFATEALMDFVMHQISVKHSMEPNVRDIVLQLVKRFEVFRRIHRAYDSRFRALDIDAHREPHLYVRAGELFEAAYSNTLELPFLNALL